MADRGGATAHSHRCAAVCQTGAWPSSTTSPRSSSISAPSPCCRRSSSAPASRKPLVVTDAGVRAAGLLDRAVAALGGRAARGLRRDAVEPDRSAPSAPPPSVYRSEGCDGLVAIGGGSSIDLAKGVAIAATHAGPLTTYATIEGGSPRISERVAPLIAVPTTAGTGSEVARGAIVIVDDGRKLGFHSWHLVPKARHLRPRADARPAAVPDRGDRHGRDRALHGDLHGAGRQSARRRHRPRRPRARLGEHRDGDRATAATARRAST